MIIGFSVKLLFNQNLSDRLPRRLVDLYPGSHHLKDLGMRRAIDVGIWRNARNADFIIVTKDKDYRRLSAERGHPPKVVLITRGKASTSEVESLLRDNYAEVESFYQDDSRGLLELP